MLHVHQPGNTLKRFHNLLKRDHEKGGAAIEYIIVSTFATILAVAAITFVTTNIQDKLTALENKVGVSFDDESINVFPDQWSV